MPGIPKDTDLSLLTPQLIAGTDGSLDSHPDRRDGSRGGDGGGSGTAGTYIVSGAGFGLRDNRYAHYTNYNSEIDGATPSELGYSGGSTATNIRVVSSDSHDGGKSLSGTYPALGNYFPKLLRSFPGVEALYAAIWFKWTAPPTGSAGIFKLFRAGMGDYRGRPKGVETIRASGGTQTDMDASFFLDDPESTTQAIGNRQNLKNAGAWHFCEYFLQLSTPEQNDGVFWAKTDGEISFFAENITTRHSPSAKIDFFINMFDGRDRDAVEMHLFQSDEYASSSQARVVITDSMEYANSTNWQLQEVLSWSDTEIKFTLRKGGLTAGANFLHVFTADNQIALSQQITIGG